MTPTSIGLIVGALLGIGVAVDGFAGLLWTAVFAAVGFVVAKVVQGDIDVSTYVTSAEQKLRERR